MIFGALDSVGDKTVQDAIAKLEPAEQRIVAALGGVLTVAIAQLSTAVRGQIDRLDGARVELVIHLAPQKPAMEKS